MKKLMYLPILVSGLFVFSTASAQKDSSGIYVTASDFQQEKLSYAINYKTEKHKINDNMLFEDADVKVVHDNKTYILKKSETYGYRNTHGQDFRFVGDRAYKMLNPEGSVLLYVFDNPPSYPKESVKYVPLYFFSVDAASSPQPLTKENLKAAYPENHKFHDALDENFKSDEGLSEYDDFHKMSKIDHLLMVSKQ